MLGFFLLFLYHGIHKHFLFVFFFMLSNSEFIICYLYCCFTSFSGTFIVSLFSIEDD